jgi:hypothetical protein
MSRIASLIGRGLLGAASVLGLFVIVLVALGIYLVGAPLRKRGLAPKYALAKAGVDMAQSVAALIAAIQAAQPNVPADQPRP